VTLSHQLVVWLLQLPVGLYVAENSILHPNFLDLSLRAFLNVFGSERNDWRRDLAGLAAEVWMHLSVCVDFLLFNYRIWFCLHLSILLFDGRIHFAEV
jgi:hypothetical protein